jgi:hypothetical protein
VTGAPARSSSLPWLPAEDLALARLQLDGAGFPRNRCEVAAELTALRPDRPRSGVAAQARLNHLRSAGLLTSPWDTARRLLAPGPHSDPALETRGLTFAGWRRLLRPFLPRSTDRELDGLLSG